MELGMVPSLWALGQALQGLSLWFTFLTHLNIVELVTCDLYNKNGFYWVINRAQGRAWRKICDKHQDRRIPSTWTLCHRDEPYSLQDRGTNNAQDIGGFRWRQ